MGTQKRGEGEGDAKQWAEEGPREEDGRGTDRIVVAKVADAGNKRTKRRFPPAAEQDCPRSVVLGWVTRNGRYEKRNGCENEDANLNTGLTHD